MYTERMYKALRRDTEGKHNQVTDLLDEIDRLTAELAKHRWIPVSERLPDRCVDDGVVLDVSVPVYVYPYLKYASATCYDYVLKKWLCSAEKTVTHWMPLPEPPKEGE